ncbi:DJ-1/PfpI family protein [Kitasatospora sp. NPDC087271]|uniref:DJ-1/PfpI family protein n=1 Tax=Kitasatospora sp. NPDC087271 TaxID=3364067 RepID=UPI0037F95971
MPGGFPHRRRSHLPGPHTCRARTPAGPAHLRAHPRRGGPAGYDLLLVPGATITADTLRLRQAAVHTVLAFTVAGRPVAFTVAGRPVAAICHGPWLPAEAGVAYGERLTSSPSVRTDLANAGATGTDEPLVTDDADGWRLVTSRNPDDLEHLLRGVDAALRTRSEAVGSR